MVAIRRTPSVCEEARGLTWLVPNGVGKLEPPEDDRKAPLRKVLPSDSVIS